MFCSGKEQIAGKLLFVQAWFYNLFEKNAISVLTLFLRSGLYVVYRPYF